MVTFEKRIRLNNAGYVTQKENDMKLRNGILIVVLLFTTGCSEFAMLMSAGGVAASHNAYVKAYNGVDVLTIMATEETIKKHIYDKGKEIIDERR